MLESYIFTFGFLFDLSKEGYCCRTLISFNHWIGRRLFLLILIHGDDLLTVIVTAAPANPVGKLLRVALRALYECGCADLPVSTTLITPCLRCFPFRDCHSLILLIILQQFFELQQRRERIAFIDPGAGAL